MWHFTVTLVQISVLVVSQVTRVLVFFRILVSLRSVLGAGFLFNFEYVPLFTRFSMFAIDTSNDCLVLRWNAIRSLRRARLSLC